MAAGGAGPAARGLEEEGAPFDAAISVAVHPVAAMDHDGPGGLKAIQRPARGRRSRSSAPWRIPPAMNGWPLEYFDAPACAVSALNLLEVKRRVRELRGAILPDNDIPSLLHPKSVLRRGNPPGGPAKSARRRKPEAQSGESVVDERCLRDPEGWNESEIFTAPFVCLPPVICWTRGLFQAAISCSDEDKPKLEAVARIALMGNLMNASRIFPIYRIKQAAWLHGIKRPPEFLLTHF
jgi:hypothetical protein